MCKVKTSSHEITDEPYVSSNYENTSKTVTADLTKTMMLRRTPHMLKKSRSLVKIVNTINFKGGANSELDKDTDKQLEIVRLNIQAQFLR